MPLIGWLQHACMRRTAACHGAARYRMVANPIGNGQYFIWLARHSLQSPSELGEGSLRGSDGYSSSAFRDSLHCLILILTPYDLSDVFRAAIPKSLSLLPKGNTKSPASSRHAQATRPLKPTADAEGYLIISGRSVGLSLRKDHLCQAQ